MVTPEADLTTYFPEYSKEIQFLLVHDKNFLEVAKDYLICQEELRHVQATGKNNLAEQYQETLNDLKEELLSYITPKQE